MTTWRPLGPRRGDGPDPVPLSASLDRLASRLGAPGVEALSTVFTRWSEVVGPVVADHTKPVALRDGVLVVAVDDPGWATQLRYLGASIIDRFRELIGEGAIVRIDVRVRRS